MQRISRRSEEELAEEVFQLERAEYERVRVADERGKGEFRLMLDAGKAAVEAFEEQKQLAGTDSDERAIRRSERKFREAGRNFLTHGGRFLEQVETEGGQPREEVEDFRRALQAARDRFLALA